MVLKFIISISFLVVFILIEQIKKTYKINSEITRKFIHIACGILVIFWTNYIDQNSYLFLCGLFFLLFIFFYKNKVFSSISTVNRKTYGELTYIGGLIILGLFVYSLRMIFIVGLLVLIIPDTLAGLYSFLYKKTKSDLNHSLIYFFFTMIIFFYFFNYPIKIILVAVTLSFTEYISDYGWDNFTVPAVYIILTKLLFLV